MKRTAVAVGALFWLSNLATLAGGAISGLIPGSANALASLYPHSTQLVAGTLITHVNEAALIGYAVLLFPVLRRYGEGAALAYVAFKLVEGVLLLVSAALLLSLIPLSQRYLAGGGADTAALRASADLTLAQQDWSGRLATLAYLVATPILNVLLYRSRLVPRVISVWGLVALALLAAGLAMGVGDPTRGLEPGQLLVIPIFLWELTFATWLIVKGFQEPAPSTERVHERTYNPGQDAGAVLHGRT
ncbi:MAG TPA: DUF4386 domain-containing protein [Candidatus Dormibacteraeota bacterium]